MGSIAAILYRSGSTPDVADARRMLAAAPHRGSEFDTRICKSVVLGVSKRTGANDATMSVEGDITAAFTGSLDNASELSRQLTAAGFHPVSPAAADIVVSAFRAYGADAPNRLRGTFAGVVTDGQHLWSFRDHLGFQPLFYSDQPHGFFAATEVKQVLAGAGIAREPDLHTLERIFYGGLRPDTPSAFKGVCRLPHATTLQVNGRGASSPRAYWHPRTLLETAKFRSAAEVREGFDSTFQQAVKRSLTGEDVVSLSGGVDSPAVAAFGAAPHRELVGRPLRALSLVYPDHPAVDERPYIELIAKSLGMELHTHVPRAKIFDDLVRWTNLLDAPIPHMSAPQMHEFYCETRKLGCRNILTGDIAECVVELPRHLAGHLMTRGRFRSLLRLMARQRDQGASLRRLRSWTGFATQLVDPFVPSRLARWYMSLRKWDFPERIPDWLDAKKVNEIPWRADLAAAGWQRWAAIQTLPLEGCPITMEGVEICTAISGVTVRRPFADVDVWEFFLSLPAEIKYPDLRSKTLLRQLLRGRVPDKILDRRDKTVFDDHVMSQVDYPLLKQVLVNPTFRLVGVDYRRLAQRLERQDLRLIDFQWVLDLTRIHAFLNQW